MTDTEAATIRNTGGTPWYVPPEVLYHEKRRAPADTCSGRYVSRRVRPRSGCKEVTKDEESYGQMTAWLKRVESGRRELDREGLVEGLVYRMLDPKHKSRIQAAQAFASLERSSIASM